MLLTPIGRFLLVFAVAAGVLPAEVTAQSNDPTPVRAFRSFERGAGARALPQSTVVALHEDKQGVIWIATLDGVARVGHGDVERLDPFDGAPLSGQFYDIIDRLEGGVHLAGNEAIYSWDGVKWSRIETPRPVISLAEDLSGRLYGVDRSGLIWWRDPASGRWAVAAGQAEPFGFVALATGPDATILAGGRQGVRRVEAGAIGPQVGGGPPGAAVTVLRIAADGTYWAGGEDGRLYAAGPADQEWRTFAIDRWDGGRIRAIGEDRRHRIWAGGDRGRVAFGSVERPFTRWTPLNGLKDASVTSIAGDRTGSVWFGYNGVGLQQWIGEAWSHRPFWREPSDSANVYAFSVTPASAGGYLVAVFSRGVWHWDGTTLHVYGREDGITEDVRYAVEPEPGLIWAGARFGIFESRNGGRFRRILTLPAGFVNGIFQAPDGRWWAATSTAGILVRNGSQWEPLEAVNQALPDPNVRHVVWRDDGEAWVATGRGVVRFAAGSFEPLAIGLPDVPTFAYALLDRPNGEMWVGGAGGIAIVDGGRVRTMTQADGLPGTTVYALASAPDGSIWAGGSSGVGRYQDGQWTVFDASDGLIAEESNSHGLLIDASGDVLVGTMSGLAHYDAGSPTLPLPPLRTFWRPGSINPAQGVVDLPADERRLVLRWSAPWPRPAPVEYRTRIARLDPSWSPVQGLPELRVENLASGRWDVEVSARLPGTGDAGWTVPLVASFTIAPHAWETVWARAAIGLAAGLIVVLLIRLRTRHLARRTAELERAVQVELARVKVLRGLLPICAHCKKIRDDGGYWRRIEDYIGQHSEADFSHGFCPECIAHHYPEFVSEETGRP